MRPWRGNFLYSYLPNILLSYHIIFNKMSNEGQEQNKISVFMNSVAEHGNVYRSSGYQADLSILSNASHSEQEGMQQDHGFAQSALQPVHRGMEFFPGNKMGWHKCLIQVLAKTSALAPTLIGVWLFMFLCRFNQDWFIYRGLRL